VTNPLAFSTLGCPGWTLERVLDAANEYGYDAVELRGLGDDLDLTLAAAFTPSNRAATVRRIADSGVAVCCVSSSGVVEKNNVDHVRAHAELARDLGCPVVRVFGGNLAPDLPRNDALRRAADTLRAFADAAEEHGVAVVLETHDAFSTGAQVAELLALADHPAAFSLWDLHHPFRQGEAIGATHAALAPTVRHVHVKDGRPGGPYTLMGDGDVPLAAMLDLLLGGGYRGPVSLEWEKRWHPELPGPEVAFPQYARALRAYLAAQVQWSAKATAP
jgi:sugar phosphate isomerase/epimerase